MRCEERDKLREGEALKRARKLVANAEATYEDCGEVLIAHERSHGCVPKAKKTASSSGPNHGLIQAPSPGYR